MSELLPARSPQASVPILHVGLHKTATTFLQHEVFPRLPGIALLRGFDTFRSLVSTPPGSRILISDESMGGHPFQGHWREEFETSTLRLAELYGPADAIIGVRRHDGLLLSLYKQHLHEGGTLELNEFYSADGRGRIRPEDLLLTERVAFLRRVFRRVFVYTLGEVQSNRAAFLAALADFLALPHVPTLPERLPRRNVGIRTVPQATLLRRLNQVSQLLGRVDPRLSLYNPVLQRLRFTPRHLCQDHLSALRGDKFELPSSLRSALRDDFADDWRAVNALRDELRRGEGTRDGSSAL